MRSRRQLLISAVLWIEWLPVGILDESLTQSVSGDSTMHSSELSNRQSRLFTFNNDESNIRVELNFAVPFLQIPVGGGKERNGHNRSYPMIDVNTNSLITTSVVTFMLMFIVPKLVHVLMSHTASHLSSRGNNEPEEGSALEQINRILSGLQLNSRGACWQKSICHLVKNASKKVLYRQGSSWDKIIDGVVRNGVFHYLAQGTGTYEAAMSGLSVEQCGEIYRNCNWDLQNVASSFMQAASSINM